MTGELERYPPPSFSAAAEPHWSSLGPLNSRRFEASRDWSWTQPAQTGPWTSHYQPQPYAGHHRHHQYPHPHGWWGSAQHHWGRKKQQKEPEFSHFCDTCDRGFRTQDKYDEHTSQHVKCSVEDCRFTAHEKLVKIHWRNNHALGAKRIRLDTAEDIARWREERRKNYPTLRNAEKKLKLMEMKEQRGDVLETAQFGTAAEMLHDISDVYSVTDAPVLRVSQALEEKKTLMKTHPLPGQSIPALHEEKHTHTPPQQSQHAPAGRGRGGKSSKPADPQRQRATLLEMLLAPDIRHERNVVLQCVRFIARSGFFGLAGKDSDEISVSVNTNNERESDEDDDPQTDSLISQSQEDRSESSCDKSENTHVNESPEQPSVFQQLFAQQLVCDESEETPS